MLTDNQATELLKRCEKIAKRSLHEVRGNLTQPKTRASAVWELLVFEAFSTIGHVEYEPNRTSCPDILVKSNGIEELWVETTFLYPRFWENDRKMQDFVHHIYGIIKKSGIAAFKISYKFYGDDSNKAGPIRKLPSLHEQKIFLCKSHELYGFLDKIKKNPHIQHNLSFFDYTFSLHYNPEAKGPYIQGSGPVEEAPKILKEHALYRKLCEKAEQHRNLNAPYIICVGSDQSPVLSSNPKSFGIRESDVATSILKSYSHISAICIVSIEWVNRVMRRSEKIAKSRLFSYRICDYPIDENFRGKLKSLNFNNWKYSWCLGKWDQPNNDHLKSVGGNLVLRSNKDNLQIEIPAKLVIESLAGRTDLIKACRNKNDPMCNWLSKGWIIKSCSFKKGDIQKGEDDSVILELVPGPESVYWPPKKVIKLI